MIKQNFVIFACISFYSLFPAAHNNTLVRENGRQRFMDLYANLIHIYAQAILAERQELRRWAGVETERLAGHKRHTRRGDKHKEPIFMQYNQYHRGNNRADRPTFAQCNKKNSKRKY